MRRKLIGMQMNAHVSREIALLITMWPLSTVFTVIGEIIGFNFDYQV